MSTLNQCSSENEDINLQSCNTAKVLHNPDPWFQQCTPNIVRFLNSLINNALVENLKT